MAKFKASISDAGLPGFTFAATAQSAALAIGGGTSATPLTTSTADKNFIGFWTQSTATSGDSRGIYHKHYFGGAGGSGEALRAVGVVNNVTAATGGTVNGAHISLVMVGASGKISGQANAARFTFEIPAASTAVGGTCAVATFETSCDTAVTIPTKMAFIRFQDLDAKGPAYAFRFDVVDSAIIANAGTGANSAAVSTGGVAAKVIKVNVAGTDYWIPLFSSNS